MKKVLSLVMAIVMLLSIATAFGMSASATKIGCTGANLVYITEGTHILNLGGKTAGKYTFVKVAKDGTFGCTIFDVKNDKYLNLDERTMVLGLSKEPYVFFYNDGLYARVYRTRTVLFFRWKELTKYYLCLDEEGNVTITSTEFVKAAVEEGFALTHDLGYVKIDEKQHKVYCKNPNCPHNVVENHKYDKETHLCECGKYDPDCAGITSVTVKLKEIKNYEGNSIWDMKRVTKYQYTVSASGEYVTVKNIELSADVYANDWVKTTSFKSDKTVSYWFIKVTDSNNKVTIWRYIGSEKAELYTVSPV